jgi:hypothetical protein
MGSSCIASEGVLGSDVGSVPCVEPELTISDAALARDETSDGIGLAASRDTLGAGVGTAPCAKTKRTLDGAPHRHAAQPMEGIWAPERQAEAGIVLRHGPATEEIAAGAEDGGGDVALGPFVAGGAVQAPLFVAEPPPCGGRAPGASGGDAGARASGFVDACGSPGSRQVRRRLRTKTPVRTSATPAPADAAEVRRRGQEPACSARPSVGVAQDGARAAEAGLASELRRDRGDGPAMAPGDGISARSSPEFVLNWPRGLQFRGVHPALSEPAP